MLRIVASLSLQRQVLDAIGHLIRVAEGGQQLQFDDTLANWYSELMSIKHSAEGNPFTLTSIRLSQEIRIAREHHAAEFRGSVQQMDVARAEQSIVLHRPDVDAAAPEFPSDR